MTREPFGVLFCLAPGPAATGPYIRTKQFRTAFDKTPVFRMFEVHIDGAAGKPVCAANVLTMAPDDACDPRKVSAALGSDIEGAVCVSAGSLMPAAAATRLARLAGAPVWCDLFGDPLAELHAEQHRTADSIDIPRRDQVWKLQRETLVHGDAFSVVSGPQRHALVGQLALLGRLRNEPDPLRRIATIPCAVPEAWTNASPTPPWPAALAERGVAPGTPYVLFAGSWNVWLDEDTIAAAMAAAMRAVPELHFAVAGIPTHPQAQHMFGRIRAAISNVGADARLHELPTPQREEEDALLAHATATVLADRDIPESLLGSRNRILAAIRWGAHPFVTPRAEVTGDAIDAGLATEIAEPDSFARAVASIAYLPPHARADRICHGRAWLSAITFERSTEPLRDWLRAPSRWGWGAERGLVDDWARAGTELRDTNPEPPRRRGLLARFRRR